MRVRGVYSHFLNHDGVELLLESPSVYGYDMKVFMDIGDNISSSTRYLEIPNVMPHFMEKFQEKFREAWTGEHAEPAEAHG